VVIGQKGQKWGFKYVIGTITRKVTTLDDRSTLYKVAAALELGCGNECFFYDHHVMTGLGVHGRIRKAKKADITFDMPYSAK
jgi:hypothetical protein